MSETTGTTVKVEDVDGNAVRLIDDEFWRQDVEPWGEPVDGDLLLHEMARTLRRFVVLPKWGPEALALWVVHTYGYDLRESARMWGWSRRRSGAGRRRCCRC